MEVEELDLVIHGTGDVKGITYTQMQKSNTAYIYEATEDGLKPYYEVFKRVEVYKFDFIKKIKLNKKKVTYPTTRVFGLSAWCYNDIDKANAKFTSL